MLAVVKKRRTKKRLFEIKGDIPEKVIDYFTNEYGNSFEIINEENDELIDIFQTDWFKDIDKDTTPGDSLRIYRENIGLTQEKLGKQLGNFYRQNISDMEHGRRSISKEKAKKLSKIFNVPIDRFL
jgi:DNA-binding XRE family transcriptional regulator